MKIIEGPHRNTNRDTVHVWVDYQGEKVLVGITAEALADDYGAEYKAHLEGFVENQDDILHRIEKILPDAPKTPDGEPRVMIRSTT